MKAERTSGAGPVVAGSRRVARWRHAIAGLLGLGFLCVGAPASVSAQKVVLLPASGAAGGDAVSGVAHSAMRDALGMQGLRVVAWDEARGRLSTGDKCDDISACTPKIMKANAAELAAGVVVSRNAQGAAERVRVALVDAEKRRYDGESEVEDGDVRTATTRALLEARSFQLLGPGPWLRVEGTPEGAEVLLDDRIVGRVPYRATIIPGGHKLRVREAGYTAFEQTLNVSATDDSHVEEVIVALEPAPLALGDPQTGLRAVDSNRKSRSGGNTWLVGPIIVGGLGAILAGVTTVRLATSLDSCINPDDDGRCTQRRRVNPVPTAIEYSVSAALIGVSAAWIVIGLSGNDDEEDESTLSARIGLDHISLVGSF